MTQINTPHTARQTYICENQYPAVDATQYGHPYITPGDLYVRLAVPPGDDLLDNQHWLTARYCGACGQERGWLM